MAEEFTGKSSSGPQLSPLIKAAPLHNMHCVCFANYTDNPVTTQEQDSEIRPADSLKPPPENGEIKASELHLSNLP